MSNKTIATAIIIAIIEAEIERISQEWRANDGGLIWAACSAIHALSCWACRLEAFDRVSYRLLAEMDDDLAEVCVYLQY